MSEFRDWNKLAKALATKYKRFQSMAIMTGSQLQAMSIIAGLLAGNLLDNRSDDFHKRMLAAADADDTKIPVIKTDP